MNHQANPYGEPGAQLRAQCTAMCVCAGNCATGRPNSGRGAQSVGD